VPRTLRSGFHSQGARVAELEERFAAVTGVLYSIATSSGTAALVLTLETLGIGPGDGVITLAFNSSPWSTPSSA